MNRASAFSTRRITMLAIFSGLAFIGRIMMQALPNIQPVTAILLILCLNLSMVDGIIVACLSILLSNIYLGMGPWTLLQIISYALLMLITGLLVKPFYRPENLINRLGFTLYAVLLGFIYGLLMSIFWVFIFKMPSFWAYYLQGLSFDSAHGLGNGIFYFLLEPIIHPLLRRYAYSNRFERVNSE
ncbi:ECF transporter S component [Ignavigranum ruoffiae]|uniref:ECF transporter S component n=1 Tax=Ignavigranum ruoffiae TaxID=89093 RepID=UPI001F3510A7|nr:ECF transporter S component [Ignavigranum ruoffiae]